jgi:hypothetical protein
VKPMNRRIVRLESVLVRHGCPTCQSWGSTACEVRTPGGNVLHRARPATCPDCGRLVPIRVQRDYLIDLENDLAA